MLPIGWLVVAVLVAILLTMWVTFTLTRLDRLHARVDAAEASLDAQLIRRGVALRRAVLAAGPSVPAGTRTHYASLAQQAESQGSSDAPAGAGHRQAVENTVGRAVTALLALPDPLDPTIEDELREAAVRVLIARRFYNDAVRDTRSLRARRLPRMLRLAGRRAQPEFFDIDDTLPPATTVARADATLDPAAGTPDPIFTPPALRPADDSTKEDR